MRHEELAGTNLEFLDKFEELAGANFEAKITETKSVIFCSTARCREQARRGKAPDPAVRALVSLQPVSCAETQGFVQPNGPGPEDCSSVQPNVPATETCRSVQPDAPRPPWSIRVDDVQLRVEVRNRAGAPALHIIATRNEGVLTFAKIDSS